MQYLGKFLIQKEKAHKFGYSDTFSILAFVSGIKASPKERGQTF